MATHDPRVLPRLQQIVTLRDGAVASVTEGGAELAVLDGSGRLQLPPELRARFPDGRVRLCWDPDGGHIRLEPP